MKHKYHRMICKLLLKKSYPELDRLIDLVGIVPVRGHRKYLHDPVKAAMLGYALYGEKGMLAGLLHVLLDEIDREKFIKNKKAKNRK